MTHPSPLHQRRGRPPSRIATTVVPATVVIVFLGALVAVLGLGSGWPFGGVAPAAGQSADPVFDQEDATDLADLLADATAAQQVCYGWAVDVTDLGGGPDGPSVGSNFGAGRALADGECPRTVVFVADITYTSQSSESPDRASWQVRSTPPADLTAALDRLGLFDEGDLTGDTVDAAVAKAVAALPQLAAEAGLAPPVVATPAPSTPPDVGAPADRPGPDYLRRAGGLLVFGVVMLLAGLAFGGYVLRTARRRPVTPGTSPDAGHAPPDTDPPASP